MSDIVTLSDINKRIQFLSDLDKRLRESGEFTAEDAIEIDNAFAFIKQDPNASMPAMEHATFHRSLTETFFSTPSRSELIRIAHEEVKFLLEHLK